MPEYTERAPTPYFSKVFYGMRWLILLGVLGASRLKLVSPHIDRQAILIAVGVIAILTLIGRLIPWLRERSSPMLVSMIDIVFVSVVVYYSDGIQSTFFPLYFVVVISSAASMGMLGALICATVCAVLAIGVELAANVGPLSRTLVVDDVISTVPYLFIIALIGGALRDMIRSLAQTASDLRARQDLIERDLQTARRIQRAQLPTDIPDIDGIDISVLYEPAREVGGDLYEFYPVAEKLIGLGVADVSGKGIPAALLVSSAKSAIHEHYSSDLAEMMRKVNEHLMAVTTDEMFVTMLYGLLHVESREFYYINAGHMPPIVIKRGFKEAICMEGSDIALAITSGAPYTARKVSLEPGDTLLLYSDGVTDAYAPAGEGLTEFRRVLSNTQPGGLENWQGRVRAKLANAARLDDATLVAITLR